MLRLSDLVVPLGLQATRRHVEGKVQALLEEGQVLTRRADGRYDVVTGEETVIEGADLRELARSLGAIGRFVRVVGCPVGLV